MGDDLQDIMSLFESESHSFVLRLWQEHGTPPDPLSPDALAAAPPEGDVPGPGQPVELRGWVEHVQTGARYYFRDLTEIKRIIAECLDETGYAEQAFEPIQTPPEDDRP